MTAHGRRDRLSIVAGLAVMVLVVAACAIKLRDDEQQASFASPVSENPNSLVTELARCRSVTPEQKDALEACRRVWAEQRRQFLGQSKTLPSSHPEDSAPNISIPAPGQPRNQNQLPLRLPSIPKSEGE